MEINQGDLSKDCYLHNTYLQTPWTLTSGGTPEGVELGMRSPIVAVMGDQHLLAEVMSQY